MTGLDMVGRRALVDVREGHYRLYVIGATLWDARRCLDGVDPRSWAHAPRWWSLLGVAHGSPYVVIGAAVTPDELAERARIDERIEVSAMVAVSLADVRDVLGRREVSS